MQAIATVLSLMNPAMCASIFARCTAGQTPAEKRRDATTASLAILVTLVLSALFGARILGVFGISLDAFSVAGGIVLIWMGFGMLKGQSDEGASPRPPKPTLTPLVLFAASPGTITGVITLSVAQTGKELPMAALVAIGVAVLITWIALLVVSKVQSTAAPSLFRSTLTSFMGLIVLAMGFQFALSGIRAFFGSH
ncbi:MAG: MarC family protein [Bdellovibrionota bacterium]